MSSGKSDFKPYVGDYDTHFKNIARYENKEVQG